MTINMQNFYMTLPSNASMSEFPSNATSHFTTRLHGRAELDGEWEVALVEASIPTRWTNLMLQNYIRLYLPTSVEIKRTPQGEHRSEFVSDLPTPGQPTAPSFRWVKEAIPDRLYHHPRQLVSALNRCIREIRDRVLSGTLDYDEREESKTVYFEYDDDSARLIKTKSLTDEIQISGQLALILGIGDGTQKWAAISPRKKYFLVDLRRGLHHIYVYSDIVQYVMVGDVTAPLLRIIPLANTNDDPEQYTHVFNDPHYIPVSRQNIETIQIDLRSDIGDYIPFVSGKSIVKLHFGRRRPL